MNSNAQNQKLVNIALDEHISGSFSWSPMSSDYIISHKKGGLLGIFSVRPFFFMYDLGV